MPKSIAIELAAFNSPQRVSKTAETGPKRGAGDLRAKFHRPIGDKQSRLEVQSARFEVGRVYLPSLSSAPWITNYVAELLAFPQGKHDDQVNATSQALNYLAGRNARRGPLVARDINRRDVVRR